jgi:3-hydroxymyristoyl/3-hydroxydecanoyl-(acyl carrier protein) dehydratase
MSPESVATISASLVDLDATFLPVAQMRQITRVTALDGLHIAAEVALGAEHWVYAQHFPEDPIFPGTLMIEAAGQLVALWAWTRGLRGRPRLVRTSAAFHAPVDVAAPRLELDAEVRGKRHLQFGTVELRAQGRHVATIDIVLAVLPTDQRPPSTST